jgi:hypothetical protein
MGKMAAEQKCMTYSLPEQSSPQSKKSPKKVGRKRNAQNYSDSDSESDSKLVYDSGSDEEGKSEAEAEAVTAAEPLSSPEAYVSIPSLYPTKKGKRKFSRIPN